jgi:hypothetical protein
MSNLIKPSDYAKQMGISRQEVYARIKQGILVSKSVDGKLYIVEGAVKKQKTAPEDDNQHPQGLNSETETVSRQDLTEVLAAKNETITILKETISDLKETNHMITSTLHSEVDLLKEAFSEMKMLYSAQIEQLKIAEHSYEADESIDETSMPENVHEATENTDTIFIETEAKSADEMGWIDLEDFFDEYGINKKKKRVRIYKRLKKLYKKGDTRIDRFNGELILLAGADYSDLFGTNA